MAGLESRGGAAAEVAAGHGVSRTAPYIWRKEIMGDDVGGTEERGVPASKGLDDLPDDIGALQDTPREVRMRLGKARLELDVRQATLKIVKKTRALTRSCRRARRRRRRRGRRGPSMGSARSRP